MASDTWGTTALTTLSARLGVFAPDDIEGTPSRAIKAELTESAMLIAATFPGVGAYENLSSQDQYWLDVATGVFTAMRIIATAIANANEGATEKKMGDVQYKFVTAPDAKAQSEWKAEIKRALGFVSAIRSRLKASASSYSMIGLASRSRGAEGERFVNIDGILPAGWGLLANGSPFVGDASGETLCDIAFVDNAAGTFV